MTTTRANGKRRHGRFKGNARALGSSEGQEPLTHALHYEPPAILHHGIRRVGERKPPPARPLNERHLAILATLGEEPQAQGAIAHALGLRVTQVTSGLYVLQRRGLAHHIGVGKGWVRVDV